MSDRARKRRHLRRRVVGLEKGAIRRELRDAQTEERHDDIMETYKVMGARVEQAKARARDPHLLPRKLR